MLNFLSRCKNVQLDGPVVVTGVHHLILGSFPQMTVYPNFSFQSRRNFLSVSFLNDIYHQQTSIEFNAHCKFNTMASTRTHHLSPIPPLTLGGTHFLLRQLSSGTLYQYIYLRTVIKILSGIAFIITYV